MIGTTWFRALLLATVFGLVVPCSVQAQERGRNRIYGEFLGPGFLYSINYERELSTPLGLRLGVGGWPESGFQYILGLGMVTIRVGGGAHSGYIGLGAGVAWFADVDLLEQTDVVGGYAAGMLAYQFQPRPKGFFVRVAYTPLARPDAIAPLWAGVSFGWTF